MENKMEELIVGLKMGKYSDAQVISELHKLIKDCVPEELSKEENDKKAFWGSQTFNSCRTQTLKNINELFGER